MNSQVKFSRRFMQESKPEAVKLITPKETNIYFKDAYGAIDNLEVTKKLLVEKEAVFNSTIKCKDIDCLEMQRIRRDVKALSLKVGKAQPSDAIVAEVIDDVMDQTEVTTMNKGLKFVNELKPIAFKSKGKSCYGLVKSEVDKIRVLAGVTPELVESSNHLSENLLPLLIKSIQTISKRLDVLEKGGGTSKASWNE